jgi:hypothetical protein
MRGHGIGVEQKMTTIERHCQASTMSHVAGRGTLLW